MKKRFSSLLFCAIILFSFIIMAYPVSAVPSEYWSIQADYTKAVEANDGDGIISVAERLTSLFANPSDANEYNMLAWPLQKAATVYEQRGQFAKATETYSKFLDCVKYLDANGYDYYDLIKVTEALIRHDSMTPAVYTVTNDTVVYHGAKNEPERSTYFGSCLYDEFYSGYLLYASFPTESFSDFDYLISGAENKKIVELAWNLTSEKFNDFDAVSAGKHDTYIINNLKYISTIDSPVLLRIFAEANCWGDLPGGKNQDAERKTCAEKFISAFRHVATLARIYAPEAAIVFSPNDISNWYVSFEDFYPGDEYVDWVGMSSYMNRNVGSNELGNGADAVYARGLYDSQIAKIKPIIDLFGDRKPIMISECGYLFSGEGQNESYSSEKLKEFYSYVNMVYPEVKAVFYFQSRNYVFENNRTMKEAYYSTVKNNLPMMSSLGGETLSYCKLDDYHGSTDILHLYTYADCPGNSQKTVTYTLNGSKIKSNNTVPYDCTVTAQSLKQGNNTLTVTVKLGADSYEFKYSLYLSGNMISAGEYTPKEEPSSWAAGEVNAAISLGFVPPDLQKNYSKGITRADLAKMLVNLMSLKSGKSVNDFLSENSVSGKFKDTNDRNITSIASLNIVNGYKQNDGSYKFKPSNTLKRAEMAAVVNRIANYFGVNTSGYDSEVNFADIASHWCKNELGWPVHAGIIKGENENQFSPDKTLTTEQTILMIYRLYMALE